MTEEVQNQQNDNDKVSKQFDANFSKLVALLGGQSIFKRPKVSNSEVSALVEELVAEQKEAVIVQFKEKARAILKKKTEFDKEIKIAEENLKKLVVQKKKEFSEEMKGLFGIVENIQEIENQYNASITEALKNDPEAL